jgi:pilus assembly protein Flp/PilA
MTYTFLVNLIAEAAPRRQSGQGMVEYGLIIALVAVVAIAGLIILGPQISSMFSGLGSSV